MFFLLLPLLFAVSLANAESITVHCSDGQAQFECADLQGSRCLKITQKLRKPVTTLSLPGINAQTLTLFIAISKLADNKIFEFIDCLSPDEFRLFDFYAKYLYFYHELHALFKYKFLKEYSVKNAALEIGEFVDSKFNELRFVYDPKLSASRWKLINLFELYGDQFLILQNHNDQDYGAFFVLVDFYQRTMKKPLKLTTQHLKNVFYSFDAVIQNELLNKKLVILP